MNTNMIRFRWSSKTFASLCLNESSLSIGRVIIYRKFSRNLDHSRNLGYNYFAKISMYSLDI